MFSRQVFVGMLFPDQTVSMASLNSISVVPLNALSGACSAEQGEKNGGKIGRQKEKTVANQMSRL
ncbi:unnamed protein product [Ectocarpus sp. CCAP 1310/34]|nr:unnamed protein product [Ectocarpus sp. CCAP 1310/34]